MTDWTGSVEKTAAVPDQRERLVTDIRTVADALPVLVWMSGLDSSFFFINRRWLKFLGSIEVREDEWWAEAIHPEDKPGFLTNYQRAVRGRQVFQGEVRLRRADGDYRWFLALGIPFGALGGSHDVYIGFCLNITDRKEAQENLASLTSHNEMILQSAGEGILGLDAEGRHTFVNPAAAQLLGYSPEDLLGRPSHPLWHHTRSDGSPYPSAECPIYAALRDGHVHRGSDEVFWRKDGASFLASYVSTPIRKGEDSAPAGAVVVFGDISKEKRLESIAEAVETMNNIGYVFSAVRHELGNPVNSLKMALTVLRKNLDRFPPQTVRDYLDRSLQELDRVEDLLGSLKSFSLYERVKPQPTPLIGIVDQLVALARPDFQARGIRLELASSLVPTLVHADPRALRQALLNCLANAADALSTTPDPVIRISVAFRDGLAEIRIADNGCGMSRETRGSLFKPFHTTKPSGTGLGLVITRNMLAKMDGTIEIESDEGAGTVVIITLRRVEAIS